MSKMKTLYCFEIYRICKERINSLFSINTRGLKYIATTRQLKKYTVMFLKENSTGNE